MHVQSKPSRPAAAAGFRLVFGIVVVARLCWKRERVGEAGKESRIAHLSPHYTMPMPQTRNKAVNDVRGLSGAHPVSPWATHPSWDVTPISELTHRPRLAGCACALACLTIDGEVVPNRTSRRAKASHTYCSWAGVEPRPRAAVSSCMHRRSYHMSHSRLLHPRKLSAPNDHAATSALHFVYMPCSLTCHSGQLQVGRTRQGTFHRSGLVEARPQMHAPDRRWTRSERTLNAHLISQCSAPHGDVVCLSGNSIWIVHRYRHSAYITVL
jgi:hypothetical protein